MKKIGITFSCPDNSMGLFSNGAKQNVLFLNELLLNIGYDSELIISEKGVTIIENLYGFNKEKHKYSVLKNILNSNYDLIIQFGFELPKEVLLELKIRGVKLVSYHCGNDYVYDMENTLHGNKDRLPQYCELPPSTFDQIWSIPQMTNTNQYYWETLYKSECVEVPFIWSPSIIEEYEKDCIKSGIGDLKYKTTNKGSISSFEPNKNVFKWSFPVLLVCENSYSNEKNIEHVYITNIDGNDTFNLKFFNNLVKPLNLFKDKKISIESRYNTLLFMSKHSEIAVSHQWENGLNYLYLDLAWMGWPVVHNAHLCKDVGYYYEGFNYKMGGEVLSDVIKNHHLNHKTYTEENRKKIDRYLPTNKDLQEKYKVLIDNLFKKDQNNYVVFYVIYCNEERLNFMKKQVSDLKLPYEFVFFKAHLPQDNVDWEVKDDKYSSNILQCCFRSHISSIKDFTEKYPNKKYVCVVEDDVCFLKEGFVEKFEKVIIDYSNNKNVDYVSIGYLPTTISGGQISLLDKEKISQLKKYETIYYGFDKTKYTIWGAQTQIFSMETSKKIVDLLDKQNGVDVYNSVDKYIEVNGRKQNKLVYLTPDSILPIMFNQGIVVPHLAIEGKVYSSIHSSESSKTRQLNWDAYEKMGHINLSNYYK